MTIFGNIAVPVCVCVHAYDVCNNESNEVISYYSILKYTTVYYSILQYTIKKILFPKGYKLVSQDNNRE